MPIVLFAALANARDSLPVECVRDNPLCRLNLLGPAFNHRHAAIVNALGFGHRSILPALVGA